jgi:hypothetical protein
VDCFIAEFEDTTINASVQLPHSHSFAKQASISPELCTQERSIRIGDSGRRENQCLGTVHGRQHCLIRLVLKMEDHWERSSGSCQRALPVLLQFFRHRRTGLDQIHSGFACAGVNAGNLLKCVITQNIMVDIVKSLCKANRLLLPMYTNCLIIGLGSM